jgi:subtilisin family serine protease
MKMLFIIILYVVSACILPVKATADQAVPMVETAGGQIIVSASNVRLSKFLEHVCRRTSTPIRVVDAGDFPVTIHGRFSSMEHLLEQVCESLAIVYERQEDGGYRIVKAEAYSRAPCTASEPEIFSSNPGHPSGQRVFGEPGAGSFSQDTTDEFRPSNGSAGNDAAPGFSNRTEKGKSLQDEPRPFYRQGQLLVQYKPGVDAAEIEALHAATGSRVLKVVRNARIHQVALLEDADLSAVLKAFKASPIVEKVGKNSLRYPQGIIPNDPKFSEQWALEAVRAPDAWSMTTGSPDVVVAVVGTGVDYKHPDLAANIWTNVEERQGVYGVDDDGNGLVDDLSGWDFAGARQDVYDDGTPEPMDRYGHGTQVAGIIAAVGDNGIGVAGVSWQTKILPLKVLADDTSIMEIVDIIAAIDYAIAAGVRVVNCSFGGPDPNVNHDGTTLDGSDNLEWDAFSRLREAGILAVCAAGNRGVDNDQTPLYPASYKLDNLISVAWQEQGGGLSIKSNYGKSSVDLAAPGGNVVSTASSLEHAESETYTSMSGTSAAVPHVSAAAALIYSLDPSIDYSQARAAILGSVQPFSTESDREKIFSGGTLDVFGSLRILGFIKGDVTLDGRVDALDAVLLLRYAAGLIELSDLQKKNGNITGHEDDDRVGVPDAVEILRLLSGTRGEQA